MFFQTEGGGETATVLLSLVMTAKAIGNPQTYLRDALLRIARTTRPSSFATSRCVEGSAEAGEAREANVSVEHASPV